MNVIYKTEGSMYVDYELSSKSITFGDDDLSINLKNRQRDEVVTVDVCADRDGYLVVGAATGYRYVAQIEIPATEYEETVVEGTDDEGNATQETQRTAKDFNIDNCTLYLYAMEV
ncbi:MAG: hypothetical protein LUD01_01295 [Clostridiales bacterium]|nr:hypothetical protein [Clostridiales bacterium]